MNEMTNPVGGEPPLAASDLISQLGDEIGILSVRVTELALRLRNLTQVLAQSQSAEANLRIALESKEEDIISMRATIQEFQEKAGTLRQSGKK